jgi:hypothetical protein
MPAKNIFVNIYTKCFLINKISTWAYKLIYVIGFTKNTYSKIFFMYANLFCKTYRSIVVFATTAIMFCQNANSQKIYYSAGERNIPSETKTYVVGNIAANTIIWEYMPQSRNSQILIYDASMRLQSRVLANIFQCKEIYQLNFICRQNSFDVIAQMYSKHNFYCQVASFTGDGVLLRNTKTVIFKNLTKTFFGGGYNCIVSANKKYFALVKDKVQAPANEIQLDCSIFYTADTLQNVITKVISIPYYKDLNTLFSPLLLDNKGNIFFAEYVSQEKDLNSHVLLYKCPSFSSDYKTCVADISGKKLADINVKLDNFKQQCLVYAIWQPQNMSAAGGGGEQNGVFSWAVNENMDGVKNDTTYILPGISAGQLPRWQNVNVLTRDAVILNDDTYTIALTVTEGRQKNMYSDDDDEIISGFYINSDPYSPGLYEASNFQTYQPEVTTKKINTAADNRSTDYAYQYAGYYDAPKPVLKKKIAPPPSSANLLLMRIDNAGNNIIWSEEIKSDHDENAFSFVNKYSLLNSGDALYFICKKFLSRDKESFESIKLDADGNISAKQIMSRNADYEILVDCGVQVTANSIIFPCIYQDKTLAFAKYELE